MNSHPPRMPLEQRPTYRQVIADSRTALERARLDAQRLLAASIYPWGASDGS
ncbi:hypothetical protein [Sphingomonas parva]|uniref:hypothetical protein n=1 Tax=Sphingomonas parva TaxID=2555898 RepID=UPI00143182DC|nr:hypothetical protein [Sphingomonas parva]